MFLKASLIAILLFAAVHAEDSMIRCCHTGGLLRKMDGSISCIPALYPDSLNAMMASLDVSVEDGLANFGNVKAGFKCREIVFDEKSGLVMRTTVTVKKYVLKNQTFKKGKRYDIPRCCKIDEYMSEFNTCIKRGDMHKFNYVLNKFANYYEDSKNNRIETCPEDGEVLFVPNDSLFTVDHDVTRFVLNNYTKFEMLVDHINDAKYCMNADYIPTKVYYRNCDFEEADKIQNGIKEISQDISDLDKDTLIVELAGKNDEYSVKLEEQIDETIVLRSELSELEQTIQRKDASLVDLKHTIAQLQKKLGAIEAALNEITKIF